MSKRPSEAWWSQLEIVSSGDGSLRHCPTCKEPVKRHSYLHYHQDERCKATERSSVRNSFQNGPASTPETASCSGAAGPSGVDHDMEDAHYYDAPPQEAHVHHAPDVDEDADWSDCEQGDDDQWQGISQLGGVCADTNRHSAPPPPTDPNDPEPAQGNDHEQPVAHGNAHFPSDSEQSSDESDDEPTSGESESSESSEEDADACPEFVIGRRHAREARYRGAAATKDKPLYPAAREQPAAAYTVQQVVYALVKCKSDYNITTEGWQAMLQIFASVLPDGNELPTSMFRCKGILGVEKLEDFWWDACVCAGHSYDPKGPAPTREDKCPCCSHPRFKPDDGSGKLIPFAGFWHLGLEAAIKTLFADPNHCAAVGQNRRPSQPNTIYGSSVAAKMNKFLRKVATRLGFTGLDLDPVFHPHNSLYSLGEDACQPFFNSPHSTNVVMLKTNDTDPEFASKRTEHPIVQVIPPTVDPVTSQKREARSGNAHLIPLMQEARLLAPPGLIELDPVADSFSETGFSRGVKIEPVTLQPDGSILRGLAFIHGFLLCAFHCDRMARVKLAAFDAFNNSLMSCQWCAMTGQTVCGASRQLGYDIPVIGTTGKCFEQPMQIGVDDIKRYYDPKEQKTRQKAAHVAVLNNKKLDTLPHELRGATGVCLVNSELRYLDWNRVWLVPFFHAFYYGVVKRFFEHLYPSTGGKAPKLYEKQPGGASRPADQPLMLNFPPEKKPAKWVINLIHERMANMVLTHDFSHAAKNPLTERGRFTMEDYKRCLLTFGSLLFASDPRHPMLHKDMEDAYGYLRRIAVNHSTVHGPEEESVRLARILDFEQQFLAFAKLVVTKLDAKMATPNLHTLVCQLGVQERERGDTVNESELWVERNIQLCKRIVKFKTTSCPEKIIGNLELLRRALLRCRFATAATLKDGTELWAAHQLKLKQLRGGVARALSSAYDPCRDDDTTAFRDKGKKVTSNMMTVIRPLLVKYLEKHPAEDQGRVPDVDHVLSAPLSSLNAYVHTLVWIDGQLCITSVDYKRQKSAQSFWVLVECEKHGQSYQQPGRVSRYLRLSLPDGQDGQPRTLRVALVDFWARPASNPVWGNENTGPGVHRLFYKPDPADKECVVALDSIVRPVIHTSNMVKSAGNGALKKLMLFVGYDHLSGLKAK